MTNFPRRGHFTVPQGAIVRTQTDKSFGAGTFKNLNSAGPKWLNKDLLEQFGPEDPALVSTLHGPMSRVLLTIPSYVFDSGGDGYLSAYRVMLKSLPDATRLEVVVHEKTKDLTEAMLSAYRQVGSWRTYVFGDEVNFSVWAQDGYAVVTETSGAQETYFVEPFSFARRADGVIADFMAHASDLETSSAPLYFQGGNILIGDDFFLIGADYPQNTLRNQILNLPDGATPEEKMAFVKRTYESYLDVGRTLHVPGSLKQAPGENIRLSVIGNEALLVEIVNRGTGEQQPIFHIDMFISLMGRNDSGEYVIAVGSPRLAEDLLGISWGELSLSELFDEVATGLSKLGFEVVRNPLPLAYYDYTDNGNYFDAETLIDVTYELAPAGAAEIVRAQLKKLGLAKGYVRQWYFATSNNVLSEIDGTSKKVWLPEYGVGDYPELETTDAANRALWEAHGFEVTGLGDFHVFAHALGAAHCITKYLSR